MSTEQCPRADMKWPVSIETDERSIDGVTLKLSPYGAYISCANPLRLYEVFDMTFNVPDSGGCIKAKAEVVFSNRYGPNDHITPRGMGVRFLNISNEDRQLIAKEILQYLQSETYKVDPKKLRSLQTLIIDQSEVGSGGA